MTRRVVVTGVSRGLGRAIAACFRDQGWVVVGIGRRAADPELPVDEYVTADLGVDGEADRAMGEILAAGSLDALVNNAAVQVNKPLTETTDADWDLVMNTNLKSAFQTTRAAASALAETNGAIVNVSSVHAVATSINVAAYAISKGALTALTRTTAVELAPLGVRCNAVLPGAVDTDMLRDGLSRRPHPDGADGNLADLAAGTPLGFVATAEQVAPSIVHLADGRLSPYTTGQTLVIDGGVIAKLGSE